MKSFPDSKVPLANKEPSLILPPPEGPMLAPMNLAIREISPFHLTLCTKQDDRAIGSA